MGFIKGITSYIKNNITFIVFLVIVVVSGCYIDYLEEKTAYHKEMVEKGFNKFEIKFITNSAAGEYITTKTIYAHSVKGNLNTATFYDKEGNVVGKFNKLIHFSIVY